MRSSATCFAAVSICLPARDTRTHGTHSPCDFDVYYSGGRGRRVYRTDFRTGESTLVCVTDSEVLDMAFEMGTYFVPRSSPLVFVLVVCAAHATSGVPFSRPPPPPGRLSRLWTRKLCALTMQAPLLLLFYRRSTAYSMCIDTPTSRAECLNVQKYKNIYLVHIPFPPPCLLLLLLLLPRVRACVRGREKHLARL